MTVSSPSSLSVSLYCLLLTDAVSAHCCNDDIHQQQLQACRLMQSADQRAVRVLGINMMPANKFNLLDGEGRRHGLGVLYST